MKALKYSMMILLTSLFLTSCYEDKGSYDYEDWTNILSVSGISIPGSSYGSVTILEGDQLVINPDIKFKPGVNESDFTYDWVMGGDTISSQKNLDWTITPVNIEVLSGAAYFWLAITHKTTGESWKIYATDINGTYSYMVKVKISLSSVPMIGVMVYEKTDGTLDWGSVKGANKKTPAVFNTILTDMYATYNPSASAIQGPFVGATLNSSELIIYNSDRTTSGASIQTVSNGTYPFGKFMGTINDITFMSATPTGELKAKNGFTNSMQNILIGTELSVMEYSSSYPYQMINPNNPGTQSGVAEIMSIKPFTRNCPVNMQLMTNGDVYHYTYSVNNGYIRVAVPDDQGNTLKVDKIVGIFRQPVSVITPSDPVKFFMIAKQGSAYIMYSYTIQLFSGTPPVITYIDEMDVSSWAGGINDNCIWFTTIAPVGWNYAYIAKGKDMWRYSFEDLATAPAIVKSFADDIVEVEVAADQSLAGMNETDELYGVVFTYNPTAKTSSAYFLDLRSESVNEYSKMENVIPGKVLKYLPFYSN